MKYICKKMGENMYNKKNGFTIAESLITLVVIGILTAFSISTIKPAVDNLGPLAYRAYDALKIAGYNVFIDMHNRNTATGELTPRPFPATRVALCNRLLEYINVTNAADARCSTFTDAGGTITAPTFTDNGTLAFTGSNSMKFYIHQPTNINVGGVSVPWFLIFVDLNGERGRNSAVMGAKAEDIPDIIPFVMTYGGEVVPVGFPSTSKKYLTSKVYYPDIIDDRGNRVENRRSGSVTYFEARNMAWGANSNANYPETINFTNRLAAAIRGLSITAPAVQVNTPVETPKGATNCPAVCRAVGGNCSCPGNCVPATTSGTVFGLYDCSVIVDSYKK